jgi:hypothetical protein
LSNIFFKKSSPFHLSLAGFEIECLRHHSQLFLAELKVIDNAAFFGSPQNLRFQNINPFNTATIQRRTCA